MSSIWRFKPQTRLARQWRLVLVHAPPHPGPLPQLRWRRGRNIRHPLKNSHDGICRTVIRKTRIGQWRFPLLSVFASLRRDHAGAKGEGGGERIKGEGESPREPNSLGVAELHPPSGFNSTARHGEHKSGCRGLHLYELSVRSCQTAPWK